MMMGRPVAKNARMTVIILFAVAFLIYFGFIFMAGTGRL